MTPIIFYEVDCGMAVFKSWCFFGEMTETVMPLLSLAAVRAAVGDGFDVVGAFGFAWDRARRCGGSRRLGFFGFDGFERFDEVEILFVGSLAINPEGFRADSHAFAAEETVSVVVGDFFEGAFVDDRLIVVEAGTFFSFESLHGDGAELDAVVGLPRLSFEFDELDSVEADVFEGFEEIAFGERTGNTTGPEVVVLREVIRNELVADDVGDDGATAYFENAEDFFEELLLEFGFDEVEDAVRNDDIDRLVWNEGRFAPELGGDGLAGEVVFDSRNRALRDFLIKGIEVELEVLNASFHELDVGVTDVFGNDGSIAVGDFEHVVGHINADDFAFRADHLRGDEADFSGARAEVEHGFAGIEPLGGVSAAVIFFDDFSGDGLENWGS